MKDPRFPELTSKQIRTLKPYGTVETFDSKTQIFSLGQRDYDFYVVLEGEVTVEDPTNDNRIIVTHQKGEFTGDSSMLSQRAAEFHGFAQPGTTLLRLDQASLKQAISQHSGISDILLNAFLLRHETVLSEYTGGIKLMGSGSSKKTYSFRDFLEKNHIWHQFIDVDADASAMELLAHFNLTRDDLPVLINHENKVITNPSLDRLAHFTGVLVNFDDKVFDVLVVGAGPAGLAASVYAASEGLDVVTIDSSAPGGQAGKSSKIENYLGFPTGISGSDLAQKAYIQAQKFGCTISIPQAASRIEHHGDHYVVYTTNGDPIKAKAVIAATGARYRRLPLENIEEYEGSGVYYSATGMDVSACANETVGIVGGGNSAGQAALFLANHAAEVHVILRGDDLGAKMSDYLVQRIIAAPNIHVQLNSQVIAMHGDGHLESLDLACNKGEHLGLPITNLFTFIGAEPCTEWVGDLVATDDKGFIVTGQDVAAERRTVCPIYAERIPQDLETSVPGFFAVGDVRRGSVKRVASAVGEGSMAVSQIHQYLGDIRQAKTPAAIVDPSSS